MVRRTVRRFRGTRSHRLHLALFAERLERRAGCDLDDATITRAYYASIQRDWLWWARHLRAMGYPLARDGRRLGIRVGDVLWRREPDESW